MNGLFVEAFPFIIKGFYCCVGGSTFSFFSAGDGTGDDLLSIFPVKVPSLLLSTFSTTVAVVGCNFWPNRGKHIAGPASYSFDSWFDDFGDFSFCCVAEGIAKAANEGGVDSTATIGSG